jgi:hypothetical protein
MNLEPIPKKVERVELDFDLYDKLISGRISRARTFISSLPSIQTFAIACLEKSRAETSAKASKQALISSIATQTFLAEVK